MLKLSDLKRIDHDRGNNLVAVLICITILAAPAFGLLFGAVFIAVGIDLIRDASGPIAGIVAMVIGAAIGFGGVMIGVWAFRHMMLVKKNTYRLFQENDIVVDAAVGKLRGVDRIALGYYGGLLKPALCHVVESPNLRRRDRYTVQNDWADYERDYVREKYAERIAQLDEKYQNRFEALFLIAEESRTEPLSYSMVYEAVVENGQLHRNKPCATPAFRVVKAPCVYKDETFDPDGGSDYQYLNFGDYGSVRNVYATLYTIRISDSTLYTITVPGDFFYLVLVSDGKKETIATVYAAFEWTPDDSLSGIIEDA